MKGMLLLAALLAIALAAAGCTGTGPGTTTPVPGTPGAADASVNETLRVFASGAQQSLDRVDANVSSAAAILATTGLTGPGSESVLLNLSRSGNQSGNYSIDAVTFDTDGKVLAVMPEDYQFAVGANIHGSSNVLAALNGTPGLSQRINLVEGFRGVALSYPVRNTSGVAGGVSLTIRPERLLAVSALAALGNTSHALSAVQTDGTIVLDANPRMIGQSILNATQYGGATDLAKIAQEIVSTPSGFERYQGNGTTRAVAWQTVGLHGTAWRLVVNQER
ncbi:MAG TPA: hypothetical protein HA263_00440 [Methanoregulaceae archaeon]|nr:hypothetical protein [Methanoregulaceae archaeon]